LLSRFRAEFWKRVAVPIHCKPQPMRAGAESMLIRLVPV